MNVPCAAAPEAWFDPTPATQAQAVAWCSYCPAMSRCRELGRDEEHGVWAGELKSPAVDLLEPATVRVRVQAPEHGSRASYAKGCHCPSCTESNARYIAEWRTERRWIGPVTPAPMLFVQLSIEGISA